MVLDSSAVVALIRDEALAGRFLAVLAKDSKRLMSSVSLLETTMVLAGSGGPLLAHALDEFVARQSVEIVPFTAAQAQLAREAFRTFGKGRHPAELNFGDCCVYALAKESGEPLLFAGGAFARTDVRSALD